MIMSRVSILRSQRPEVEASLKNIEFEPQEIETLVIKPSLCCKMPSSTGATVDLSYIEEILRLYEGLVGEVYVVEGDHSPRDTADDIAHYLGLMDLLEYHDARWVNLSRDITIPVERDFIALERGFPIPRAILKADLLVNLGKMRTDKLSTVSLGIGNLFSIIPHRRERFFPVVNDALSDILMVRAPDINIIDGIVGMEGEAPLRGRAKKMNLTLAGEDIVALDTIACHAMGINPVHVEHIVKAGYYGFGEYVEKRIDVVGSRVEDVRDKFLVP